MGVVLQYKLIYELGNVNTGFLAITYKQYVISIYVIFISLEASKRQLINGTYNLIILSSTTTGCD